MEQTQLQPDNDEQEEWIVHGHYGVGRVEGKETKSISGEETDYYKIKTHNSTIWVSVDQFEENNFRPVADKKEFKQVLSVLKKPSKKMDTNFNKRKSRIKEVLSRNSPVAIARLVRDLWGRRTRRSSLSSTEQSVLRRVMELLVQEWAVAQGVDEEEARTRLVDLLQDLEHEIPAAQSN